MARRVPLLLLALAGWLVGGPAAAGAAPQKGYLLEVSSGQLPNDTGLGDKTFPEIVDGFKDLGGGKAMKVTFFAGDSFGNRGGGIRSWRGYETFRMDVFNPSRDGVSLELNVVHSGSSGYHTRVVEHIRLKSGRNEVKLGVPAMRNVNGSPPNLENVIRWFVADPDNKAPTLYFGDIWLEGGDGQGAAGPAATPRAAANPAPSAVPAQPAPAGVQATAGGAQPPVGYRIKGKFNGGDVDLTVTPFEAASMVSAVAAGGDPARLARIRASRMPAVDKPVQFNTPEADAICAALEVFPPDNPWNLVVESWPLHPGSRKMIDSIGRDKPFRDNLDMGFVLVPPNQKRVDVKIVTDPGESDKGPFPIPDNVPIEGWPVYYKDQKNATLEAVQRRKEDGDRHALVVDPVNRMLYEFYQMRRTDSGWQAGQASTFDLKSNQLRPESWTSSDAAGLPVFPAVVRYDELQRGMVEHAMRVTIKKTRRAYVAPATHYASRLDDESLPRMGERIRLRKDFDVSSFSPEVQAILKGLKKYGMFVADNGIDWAISIAPDPRIKVSAEELRRIKGSDFEVVVQPPG